MFWFLPGLLSFIIPILLIGAVVYLIVHRRNAEDSSAIYDILMCYFYFMIGTCVILTAAGIGTLLYVAFHQAYGGGNMGNPIALGLTLSFTGAIICTLHVLGKMALEKKNIKITNTIRRIYLFIMLIIFSLSGIVALPMGIYALAHYYVEGSRHWDDPSAPLATALVVVPLWVYYLMRVMREVHAKKAETPVSPG